MAEYKSIKPQRLHNETHEEYRQRRREANAALKSYKKGRMVHVSKKFDVVKLTENGEPCGPGDIPAMAFLTTSKGKTYVKHEDGEL